MTPTLKKHLESLERGAPAASIFGVPIQSVKRSFKSACRRAGVPWVTFHTLRRSGATLLLDSGVPLKVVQEIGNWKDPHVLLRHYAAATPQQKRKALTLLDGLAE